MSTGFTFPGIDFPVEHLPENVVGERAFSRAADSGDADEVAQRNRNADAFQVVVSSGVDCQAVFSWCSSLFGDGDRIFPAEETSSDASRVVFDLFDCPLGHHPAASNTRPGTEVHDVIGRSHGLFVVFDDDHGVALVSEIAEALEQQLVVAWVESDRGFIEDVDDTDQSAADLSGQADALRFASGKSGCGSVECEVVESTFEQEAESCPDFLEHFGGDQLACRIEFDVVEEICGFADRQGTDIGQAASTFCGSSSEAGVGRGDCDGLGLRVQPRAVAGRAVGEVHRLFEHPSEHRVVRLVVPVEQFGDDSGKRPAVLPDSATITPGKGDVPFAGPVEDQVLSVCGQLVPRCLEQGVGFESDVGFDGSCGSLQEVSSPSTDFRNSAQHLDGSAPQRLVGLGHQVVGQKLVPPAEPVAVEAHAQRAVEAEELRRGGFVAEVAG